MSLDRQELVNETITAALSAVSRGEISQLYGMKYLVLEANFTYGSGGTTLKAWVQTSLDGGATWIDIANFAFTTASGRKITTLDLDAVATAVVPTDGSLADNAIVDGILGDRVRVKLTTTGTYAGDTTFELNMTPKA